MKDNAFSSAADTVGFNGIKPQKSPAWIQGIWRATTDYGVITLKNQRQHHYRKHRRSKF